jgi:hypothetical protein
VTNQKPKTRSLLRDARVPSPHVGMVARIGTYSVSSLDSPRRLATIERDNTDVGAQRAESSVRELLGSLLAGDGRRGITAGIYLDGSDRIVANPGRDPVIPGI